MKDYSIDFSEPGFYVGSGGAYNMTGLWTTVWEFGAVDIYPGNLGGVGNLCQLSMEKCDFQRMCHAGLDNTITGFEGGDTTTIFEIALLALHNMPLEKLDLSDEELNRLMTALNNYMQDGDNG